MAVGVPVATEILAAPVFLTGIEMRGRMLDETSDFIDAANSVTLGRGWSRLARRNCQWRDWGLVRLGGISSGLLYARVFWPWPALWLGLLYWLV